MGRRMLRTGLLTAAAALAVTADAMADNMGAGVGAMRGAILGDLIAGGHGAAVGAAVGAMIGAPEAAARKEQHLAEQQAAVDARLAQWEADQRAREIGARERQEQQEERARQAALGVDEELLVQTQRSLIDLGYDPGPIGIQSPELTTAIVRYQQNAGLLPTGAMSMELLDRMITDSLKR